jgi:thioredoxin-like negative regulator of GroEL
VYLLADGRLDESLAQFRSVQAIHPNTDPNVAIDIVHVLILQGRHDEAAVAMALVPEGNQREQGLALLYAATGHDDQADEALGRMTVEPRDFMDTIRVAEVYAFRGMADQAFDVLNGRKQTLAREHGAGSVHVWYLQFESKLSPFLKTLHSDPRWSTYIAASG